MGPPLAHGASLRQERPNGRPSSGASSKPAPLLQTRSLRPHAKVARKATTAAPVEKSAVAAHRTTRARAHRTAQARPLVSTPGSPRRPALARLRHARGPRARAVWARWCARDCVRGLGSCAACAAAKRLLCGRSGCPRQSRRLIGQPLRHPHRRLGQDAPGRPRPAPEAKDARQMVLVGTPRQPGPPSLDHGQVLLPPATPASGSGGRARGGSHRCRCIGE